MKRFILIILLLAPHVLHAAGGSFEKIVSLEGYWRFEIGDNLRWSDPQFDDSGWEKIHVPATWEDEGFPGYDGYAWYRLSFELKGVPENNIYYLRLGKIDDVDETYINGKLVGYEGRFPPDYSTGAAIYREYRIPAQYLNENGVNVIAVRVYDDYSVGGIRGRDVGLYMEVPEFVPTLNLSGLWKFKMGDDKSWKEPGLKDDDWQEIIAPAVWQTQGFKDKHGFAWYRKNFVLPDALKGERLILLLGKIDDMDETYLNGHLIGRTGRMNDDPDRISINNDDWAAFRAYYIQSEYLNESGNNTLAVRVFDGPLHGGIYEGPLGIITREKYMKWRDRLDKRRGPQNIFEFLFGIE